MKLIHPLKFNPDTLPNAEIGVPYYQEIKVSEGVFPYTWGSTGSLPLGLVFEWVPGDVLKITGTPTEQIGTDFPFTVTATDSIGFSGLKDY